MTPHPGPRTRTDDHRRDYFTLSLFAFFAFFAFLLSFFFYGRDQHMSSYMLGSLSNSDYDDYFKQHMNRIYHRSDSFRTMLAGEHDAVLCDDPYCHEYRRPSSSANTRKPRRPSRRRTASVSATSSRREQPRRMPSREDLYGGREVQIFWGKVFLGAKTIALNNSTSRMMTGTITVALARVPM